MRRGQYVAESPPLEWYHKFIEPNTRSIHGLVVDMVFGYLDTCRACLPFYFTLCSAFLPLGSKHYIALNVNQVLRRDASIKTGAFRCFVIASFNKVII